MQTITITNPETGRQNACRAWFVEPKKVLVDIKAGATAKQISWKLLSDDEAYGEMQATEDGDSARNNFALHIFENALDWGLGLAIIRLMVQAAKLGKRPKPFYILANRKGDIFYKFCNGKIVKAS